MIKNKWFKFFILSTAIFAVFAIKHLVVLDAIETTEVSYTEDTSPNEVLTYKDGVSFKMNNTGSDIPLYISQETLEETPEELVIEVSDPEEKTITVVNEEAKKETEKKTEETKQNTNKKSNVNTSDSKKNTTTKTTETKQETTQKETTKPKTEKPAEATQVVPSVKPPVVEEPKETIKEETPVVKEPVIEKPIEEKNVFEDIVFIGDSIMVGLENHVKNNHSKVSSAEFIAKGGVSAYHLNNNELVTYKEQELNIIDALKLSGRKSIFISLGTNDLVSFDVDTVVDNLSTLCNLIKTNIPDANINIISTTYVVNGQVNGNLSTSNVLMYNYKVKKFAERNGYAYINWSHLLNDDYGNLAEKYSSDNYVHLNEEAYKIYVKALEEEIK